MYKSLMFNEELLAEEIFKNGFINKQYDFTESVLVAKQFRHVLGYGDARVKSSLIDFCERHDKYFNKDLYFTRIKSAVSKSRKGFVNKSMDISICQDEIDVISQASGYKQKRVLFALLVLCKKEEQGNIYTNAWASIRHVLHSKISNSDISMLMNNYYSLGLVDVSYSFHTVKFINRESPSVMNISPKDIYNLNKVFEEIFGKDLFVCADCGESHERHSYNQKRCHNCSVQNRKSKVRSNVKRYRERKNNIV